MKAEEQFFLFLYFFIEIGDGFICSVDVPVFLEIEFAALVDFLFDLFDDQGIFFFGFHLPFFDVSLLLVVTFLDEGCFPGFALELLGVGLF
jgi:hypothetical protein